MNVEKLSEWERQSTELIVSELYREEFKRFLVYIEAEIAELQDKDLEQEVKLY